MAAGPYVMASGILEEADTTLVRLTLSDGSSGWGETCPVGPTYAEASKNGARTALQDLIAPLIGRPASPFALHDTMDGTLTGLSYAKAALDMALHDALAHSYGIPLSALLGGQRQAQVPAYYALTCTSLEETRAKAKDLAAQGYRRIQVKVGALDLREDVERLRAVHDDLGPEIILAADANRKFPTAQALTFSALTKDIPLVLEQPCNTLAENQSIRERLHHPLLLDENLTSVEVCRQALNFIDGASMKITRLGGHGPFGVFRDMAAARSMAHTVDDAWGSDIMAAHCVHMAATVLPKNLAGVWIAQPHIRGHVSRTPVKHEDGWLKVPEGPGLGLDIDPAQFGAPLFEG